MLFSLPTDGNFPLAMQVLHQICCLVATLVQRFFDQYMSNCLCSSQTMHLSKLYMMEGSRIFSRNAEKGIVLIEKETHQLL